MASKAILTRQLKSSRLSCACVLTLYSAEADGTGAPDGFEVAKSGNLVEDRRYWYTLEADDCAVTATIVVDGTTTRESPRHPSEGILDTRSQAGIFRLDVKLCRESEQDVLTTTLDIYPAKFDLMAYRAMVDDICQYALGLALRLNSSTCMPLRIADRHEESAIAQRFFFLRYLLNDTDFLLALDQITKNPHSRINRKSSERQLSSSKRLDRHGVLAIASGRDRIPIPNGHALSHLGTLPRASVSWQATETTDTTENRFVRFALHEFAEHMAAVASVCEKSKIIATQRIANEATSIYAHLKHALDHPALRDVGESSLLPLGSPVLHRRPGYRELFSAWLQFHVAASLDWEGGEEVFGAGKRDTDKLYEYWLFFQLLNVLSSDLGISLPAADQLLSDSEKGLSLKLKAGKNFVHEGSTFVSGHPLHIKFSYNRTFHPAANPAEVGSWSLSMRPDFTISFWPEGIEELAAERLHLLVHIHFDAKYRIRELEDVSSYNRDDFFVAHTYRDAIRRSGGAYVLYPGSEDLPSLFSKRAGVLPGVGAIPVRPTLKGHPSGIEHVAALLHKVANQLGSQQPTRESLRMVAWAATDMKSGLAEKHTELPECLLFLPSRDDCISSIQHKGEELFVLRGQKEKSDGVLLTQILSLCSAVFIEDDNGRTGVVIPFEFVGDIEKLELYGSANADAQNTYVAIRLNSSQAIGITAKSEKSFQALREFSSCYLGSCSTLEVVQQFATVDADNTV
ncbi:DUF2357 domain-containing protein [Acidovorax sp.]|uniref:DUF2357 domain-containing protein n=1 Tax=Acidovorax sp. TaxID=1872122 RepID=UPI003CFDF68D